LGAVKHSARNTFVFIASLAALLVAGVIIRTASVLESL
jgi:hypothetical protein